VSVRNEIYRAAWRLLQKRLDRKNSWGKNEMHTLMYECLQDSIDLISGPEVPLAEAEVEAVES